jgi:hypothetical protein
MWPQEVAHKCGGIQRTGLLNDNRNEDRSSIVILELLTAFRNRKDLPINEFSPAWEVFPIALERSVCEFRDSERLTKPGLAPAERRRSLIKAIAKGACPGFVRAPQRHPCAR